MTKKLGNAKPEKEGIRLNKYLSDAGICSRRQADLYIAEGKVTVDGKVAREGVRVMPGQKVCYEGKPIQKQEECILLVVNKPKGIVCTTRDRKTI